MRVSTQEEGTSWRWLEQKGACQCGHLTSVDTPHTRTPVPAASPRLIREKGLEQACLFYVLVASGVFVSSLLPSILLGC